MGIAIFPPDINKSKTWFSIEVDPHSLEGKAIRFGLAAIKNVGEAAIEAILLSRDKDGSFHCLSDLCARVDGQKANKKVLESLIQVGAFDFCGKRAAMMTGLEKIRQQSLSEQKYRADGQVSLFETAESAKQTSSFLKDELPEIEELAKPDLLSLEKNLLGLYLTEHPLEKAMTKLDNLVSHKIFELDSEELSEAKVKVGGIVASIRKVFTKKGNNEMAFVTLEDRTGSLDLVVFPRLYAQVKDILLKDRVIVVEGKLDKRDDRLSLIVDNLVEVEAN